MTAPSYFCQEGIPRPHHIKHTVPLPLLPGKGPEGLSGVMYGRPYDPSDVYAQTGAGWWMCLDGVLARDLVRTNCLPGKIVGNWLVPQLLDLDGTTATCGYWGPSGYIVPDVYAPIVDALRSLIDEAPGLTCTAQQASLAADILALNYHVSLFELGYWASLTPTAVWAILQAAVGVPPRA